MAVFPRLFKRGHPDHTVLVKVSGDGAWLHGSPLTSTCQAIPPPAGCVHARGEFFGPSNSHRHRASPQNPAGLVDAHETVENAAVRELREETGYVATKVTRVSRPIFNDPGLSPTNFCFAFVDCDLDDPRNANPTAQQEEGENIELVVLPIASLLQSMETLAERDGLCIDAKCYSFALGMSCKM